MGFQSITVVLLAGVLIRLIGLNEKAGENKHETFLSILPCWKLIFTVTEDQNVSNLLL